MRVQKVLHPTDFSPASRAALPAALFLAELYDAELLIEHMLVFRSADLAHPEAHFPAPEELFEKLQAIAASQLGELLHGATERPLRLRQRVVRAPDETRGILDRAEEEEVDLIVLGTHGRTGAMHLLMGSVAAEVLRRARCPVLTVPSAVGAHPFRKLSRILAADDFSAPARRALDHAAALAREVGAELDIAHVLESPEMPVPPGPVPIGWGSTFYEELEPTVRAGLAEDRRARAPECAGRDHVLRGRGALALIEAAGQEGADLIVQATQGRTGLDRLLLGSFAERVARLAHCPVLTVPAGGKLLV
jgi:nucleotide-binding universal stress UspA family protein